MHTIYTNVFIEIYPPDGQVLRFLTKCENAGNRLTQNIFVVGNNKVLSSHLIPFLVTRLDRPVNSALFDFSSVLFNLCNQTECLLQHKKQILSKIMV